MSKRRSILRKLDFHFDYPDPDDIAINPTKRCYQDTYFGENLEITQNDEFDMTQKIIQDVFQNARHFEDIYENESVGWSQSSLSSASGSEDLENEAALKIKSEYDRMERIMFGEVLDEDEDPKKEEYQDWMDNFPHLRIIGTAMKINRLNLEPCGNNDQEEVIAEHYDDDIDLSDDSDSSKYIVPHDVKAKLKEAVINKLLKEAQSRIYNMTDRRSYGFALSNKLNAEEEKKKVKSRCSNTILVNSTKPSKPTHIPEQYCPKNNKYLQISTVVPTCRYQSPLAKSHQSAAKWQRNSSGSSSLPHIVPNNTELRSDREFNRSSANSRKMSGTPRSRNVTLPPIQKLSLSVEGDTVATPKKVCGRPKSFNTSARRFPK